MKNNNTALVVHEERAPAVREDVVPLSEVVRLAEMIVPTGLLPEWIKNPGQAVAIILAGRELGMPAMRSLRSLVLIKGKVVESADSQLSRFKTDGGRAQFKTLDATQAVLWLKHPNGDEHIETFTIEDANRAGLTKPDRNGGPSMFLKFPKPMLRSRAITSGLKSIGWEGGAGAYDPDEAAAFMPMRADEKPVASAGGVELRETMSLADATAFVMPIGQMEGTALGDLPSTTLRKALEWTWNHPEHEALNEALSVLIMEREKSEAKGEHAGDGPSHSAAGEVTPQPSSGAAPFDAFEPYPEEAFAKLNAAQLQARAVRLLDHPSMREAFVNGTSEQINSGLAYTELRKLVRQLEAMIAAAPQKRARGEKRAVSFGDLPGDPA